MAFNNMHKFSESWLDIQSYANKISAETSVIGSWQHWIIHYVAVIQKGKIY